jgi:hypothetical protein
LKDPSDFNAVKAVVADVPVAVDEAWVELLQTMAEMISLPFGELFILMSGNDNKRRDVMFFSARR